MLCVIPSFAEMFSSPGYTTGSKLGETTKQPANLVHSGWGERFTSGYSSSSFFPQSEWGE